MFDIIIVVSRISHFWGRKLYELFFTIFSLIRPDWQYTSSTLRKCCKELFSVEVGMYTYGGCFSIDFNDGGRNGGIVLIGNYCSFARNIRCVHDRSHKSNRITTSPIFSDLSGKKPMRHVLHIGNDVWIGERTIILDGCTKIGNGAIIGAGAVVTHDIGDYEIWAGNPAKKIGRRNLTDAEKEKLSKSNWWNLDQKELEKIIQFEDVDEFCLALERLRTHSE